MKAYILTDEDFEKLLSELDKDPKNAYAGQTLSQKEQIIFQDAHRFYNFIFHKWLDKVTK